ncbi:hypothetical protein F2Q68_00044055 [Brassica cretica]|uniref:Uncharacterized protein n=2 Tax=Brassica cretica TaxID=69181 RepID=A0ABQ7ASD1_BRACR|nr:hypothetical protein F2Q68_00044055 [Brassica cretica]KAF3516898.1 hypothetical protein DY000_02060090 [Brassica cretica]
MFVGAEPPGVFTEATTRREIAKLVIIVRSPTVATDHAAIRVWTKPLEPPEVLPQRARELHAPPPQIVAAAFAAFLRRKSSPQLPLPSSAARAPPDRCRITVGPPPDHQQTATGLPPDHRLAAAGRRDSPVTQ